MISLDFGFDKTLIIPQSAIIALAIFLFVLILSRISRFKVKIEIAKIKFFRSFKRNWYFISFFAILIICIIKRTEITSFTPFSGYSLLLCTLIGLSIMPFIKNFDILGVKGEFNDFLEMEYDENRLNALLKKQDKPSQQIPERISDQEAMKAKFNVLKKENEGEEGNV